MNYHRGFVAFGAIAVVLALVVLGGAAYLSMHKTQEVTETTQSEQSKLAAGTKTTITWRFTDAGEQDNIPYTNVTVLVNGTVHDMGKFQGSCVEVTDHSVVGDEVLLAGELAAAQCWFAGGGDEIGVFADEDGGFDLMVGELSEAIEGSVPFRGNFEVKQSLKF